MTSASPTENRSEAIPVRDVVLQLADELQELAFISAEVEGDIGSWLGLVIAEMDEPTSANAIRRLQRLDALTQTLNDLSNLAAVLAQDATGVADVAALAASARLERVARLALVQRTKDRAVTYGLTDDITLF